MELSGLFSLWLFALPRGSPVAQAAVKGLKLVPLDNDLRDQLGLDDDVKGVVIDVSPTAGPTALQPGDIIDPSAASSSASPKHGGTHLSGYRRSGGFFKPCTGCQPGGYKPAENLWRARRRLPHAAEHSSWKPLLVGADAPLDRSFIEGKRRPQCASGVTPARRRFNCRRNNPRIFA